MSFNKKFFATGGIVASSAECTTESTDIFGDGNGVALYSLDYDASTAQDAATDYSGTPTDVTFGVGGKIKYGARFNGSGSKITIPAFSVSDLKTVSFWFKSTQSASNKSIFSMGTSTYSWLFIQLHNGQITAAYSASDGGFLNNSAVRTSSTYNDGNWHHVVCVFTGTLSQNQAPNIYVDSVDVATTLQTGSANPATAAGGGVIGDYAASAASGTQYYSGDIDQVRIFSSALTDAQVSTLFAEEACVHTSTTDQDDYPIDERAYFKFDNTTEDEEDTHSGTSETDIEYRFGRYGQAVVFNGTSSQIDTTATLIPSSTDFSVSFWINPSNQFGAIIARGNMTTGNNGYGFDITYVNSSKTTRMFRHTGGAYVNEHYVVGESNTIPFDTWTHVVWTFDKSTGQPEYYVNGVEKNAIITPYSGGTGSSMATGNIAFFSTYDGGKYRLGNRNNNYSTSRFKGKLDQFKVFDSVLTFEDVTDLYNEKPETDTSNFKAVLYTGDGGSQYISNVGFQPDLVWIKSRDVSSSHTLHDSVRGYDADGSGGDNSYKPLHSNTTSAETAFTSSWHSNFGYLNSLESNGFIVVNGTGSTTDNYNKNNEDYVAWVWKAGGDAVSNTNGTVGTSDVSASDKGFSIVNWSATTTTTHTVGHGLNIDGVATKPELMIMKNASSSSTNWFVYTDLIDTSMDFLYLNEQNAKANSSLSVPNTTTFQQGNLGGVSAGNNCIAYLFASVSGYSKIGTYTGGSTGSANAISCGFQPSWLMVKCYDSTGGPWRILDQRRGDDTDGNVDDHLVADSSAVESVNAGTTWEVVFTSDGFYFTGKGTTLNGDNRNFLFMAFK